MQLAADARCKAINGSKTLNLELKVPPLGVTAASALVMWVVSGASCDVFTRAHYYLWFAVLFYCVGLGVVLAAVVSFRKAKTTVDPRVPHQTSALVSSGVYRLSRNPMYVGFTGLLLGWAAHLESLWSLLVLPIFVAYLTRYQILPEERAMQKTFGNRYTGYCAAIRRWF